MQNIAVSYNTLQHTATHCNTLQHTATHCNSLQLTATHCNTLQHSATHIFVCHICSEACALALFSLTQCNTVQHTAAHCKSLQHTATHCNTLQHTYICVPDLLRSVRARALFVSTNAYPIKVEILFEFLHVFARAHAHSFS